MPEPLSFNTDFDPHYGQAIEILPGVKRLTAPNASAYTFTGTNSYVLGGDDVVIVDPGSSDETHLALIMATIGQRRVQAIVLTHTHRDHTGLVRAVAAKTGAPLMFAGAHRLSRPLRPFEINPLKKSADWRLKPDVVLNDGDRIKLDGMTLDVVATPGHCANHIAIGIADTPFVLTGDHVMGWNSTLVATPDGSMADYFQSLDTLLALPYQTYLPAHGGEIEEGKAYARALKAHREARNGQILEALQTGPKTLGDLRKAIYPQLPVANWAAALMTLGAHVEYLQQAGLIARAWGVFGQRYRLTR